MKNFIVFVQTMGGIYFFIQLLIIAMILVLSIQKFIQYFRNQIPEKLVFHRSHHVLLFLGIFCFVWGALLQIMGFIGALGEIIVATDISPQIVLKGMRITFVPPAVGLGTMLISALLWAILQGKYTSTLKDVD